MKHDLPPPPPSGASVEVLLAPARGGWLKRLLIAGLLMGLGGVGAVSGLLALLVLGATSEVPALHELDLAAAPAAPAPVPPPALVQAAPARVEQGDGPVVEVAFVIDTTGSMGGLLRAAKQKAWSIVNELANAQPRPTIRLGLVAYRDQGDAYVTRATPLTDDLDAFYEQLLALGARGGGDDPEAVDQGLEVALTELGWRLDRDTINPWTGLVEGEQPGSRPEQAPRVRLAFLLGDQPPHAADVQRTQRLAAEFAARGIRLNAIQLGDRPLGPIWRSLAQAGGGEFFELDQRPQTVSLSAPQDGAIVAAQQQLEQTVLPYGSPAQQASTRRRWQGNTHLGREAYSSRASALCKTGKTYAGDLLQALETGAVASVDDLDPSWLPETLQALAPTARRAHVERLQARRAELRGELAVLVAARDAWLRSGAAQARDTFDRTVLDCLARQLEAGGFRFGC